MLTGLIAVDFVSLSGKCVTGRAGLRACTYARLVDIRPGLIICCPLRAVTKSRESRRGALRSFEGVAKIVPRR